MFHIVMYGHVVGKISRKILLETLLKSIEAVYKYFIYIQFSEISAFSDAEG